MHCLAASYFALVIYECQIHDESPKEKPAAGRAWCGGARLSNEEKSYPASGRAGLLCLHGQSKPLK